MEIALRPEHEKLLRDQIANGQFASADEAVAAALELLRQQEAELTEEEYRMVKAGFDEIQRGEYRELRTPEDYQALLKEICEGSKQRRSS